MTATARFVVFLSVVLGIWLAQHLYVGWRLAGLPLFAGTAARRWLLVGLALGFVSYPAGRILWHHGWLRAGTALEYLGGVWMGALFLLVAFLLASEVVTLGGLVMRPWLDGIRTGAAGLAAACAVAGFIGGLVPPRVLDVELELPGLSAEADGLTLVQLSDVHLGTVVGERFLNRLVDRIDALEPDLVVLTGDLVDGEWESVGRLIPILRRLRAPLGVYAVPGNHEYYAGIDGARRMVVGAGFTWLENAHVEVAGGLVVAGVADARGAAQTGAPGADLAAALEGVDPSSTAVVLLQHSPEREAEAAAAGVDLMLSGHTHGGQIWPFSYVVRLAYPHLAGVYQVGDMKLVVSRGAGRWGPPMRLFAPADIVRVTFRAGDTPNPSSGETHVALRWLPEERHRPRCVIASDLMP